MVYYSDCHLLNYNADLAVLFNKRTKIDIIFLYSKILNNLKGTLHIVDTVKLFPSKQLDLHCLGAFIF